MISLYLVFLEGNLKFAFVIKMALTYMDTSLPTRHLRDKTMDGKLRYIPYNVKQDFLFSRLEILVETFGHY